MTAFSGTGLPTRDDPSEDLLDMAFAPSSVNQAKPMQDKHPWYSSPL